MGSKVYNKAIQGKEGAGTAIAAGLEKTGTAWNTETENKKTLAVIQGADKKNKVVCIDGARLAQTILRQNGINSSIAVMQGKSMPHAFNTFQNPDTGKFYAVTTDAVGQAPKIVSADSRAALMNEMENWQLQNSRTQGTREIVFLDEHGEKVGAYETPTQKAVNDLLSSETGVQLFNKLDRQKSKGDISVDTALIQTSQGTTVLGASAESTWLERSFGATDLSLSTRGGISHIMPGNGSYARHKQDTDYATGTGLNIGISNTVRTDTKIGNPDSNLSAITATTLDARTNIGGKGISAPSIKATTDIGLAKSGKLGNAWDYNANAAVGIDWQNPSTLQSFGVDIGKVSASGRAYNSKADMGVGAYAEYQPRTGAYEAQVGVDKGFNNGNTRLGVRAGVEKQVFGSLGNEITTTGRVSLDHQINQDTSIGAFVGSRYSQDAGNNLSGGIQFQKNFGTSKRAAEIQAIDPENLKNQQLLPTIQMPKTGE